MSRQITQDELALRRVERFDADAEPAPRQRLPEEFDWDDAIDEDSGYSPYTVYAELPSQEAVTVRLPSFLVREMAVLVEQRRIPQYQTRSDIIKDAIFHRVKFANDHLVSHKDPDLDWRMAAIAGRHQQEQALSQETELEELIEILRKRVDNLVKLGAWERLSEALHQTRFQFVKLPEPWRTEGLKVIEDGERQLREGMR